MTGSHLYLHRSLCHLLVTANRSGSTKGTLTHWSQEYDGFTGPTPDYCTDRVFII